MANKIDLDNFRVVKSGNEDHDRNYINDVLHAIVAKIKQASGTVVGVMTLSTDSTIRKTGKDSGPSLSAQPAIDISKAYTDAQIAALPPSLPDAPSDGNTYGRKDGAWAVAGGGSASAFLIPLYAGQLSTKATSGNKRLLGSLGFDPSDSAWALSASSTARLCVLLETTNSLASANAELLFRPTTGAPTVIASVPSVTSLVASLTTVDVSSYFRPSSPGGTLQLRMWSSLATESSTCTGSWIEVIP